jgi:hypothetical protein
MREGRDCALDERVCFVWVEDCSAGDTDEDDDDDTDEAIVGIETTRPGALLLLLVLFGFAIE